MNDPLQILGIAGSLRDGSFNRSALRAAQALVPAGATLQTFDIKGLPGFSQDDEANPPAQVVELKQRIRNALPQQKQPSGTSSTGQGKTGRNAPANSLVMMVPLPETRHIL